MSAPRPTASAARGVTIGGFSGREKDEKKKDDDEDEKRKHEPRR